MRLGVDYYPEHWPEERWATDARMMREAGLQMVRIGEFAWAKMEPAEGQYDWAWLDKAIETLAGEGLKVILGTPTPTPPAWLVRAYPEVLPVDKHGHVREFGSRRHVCHNSPVYRQYTRQIVTALAERYGQHPAVIGWQTDNEFGCHDTARCYCERCAAAFRVWLQNKYGTLEALNHAWGAIFWSQSYTEWEQIKPPNLTVTEPNASHVLDYYRFSSDSVCDYQMVQVDILRRLSPGKFVTHNYMGTFDHLDYFKLGAPLDFVTWDSYPTGYKETAANELYLPDELRPAGLAFDVGDPYVTGFCHDLTRGIKQAPYWVMEQQPGGINWASLNPGVRPGAVRLWTWHAVASGAEAVVYFRWRACLYAQEQYHTGLLKHDASPDTGYEEVLALKDLRPALDDLSAQPWQAEVALLSDYENVWALQLQPHRRDFSAWRHLFRYYRALAKMGVACDIVSPGADLSRYKLVIAPTLHLADDALAQRLEAYVQAGGRLLLGVRSGFKTPTNLVTDQPLPGALRRLAGVRVGHWHALPAGARYEFRSSVPGLHGPAEFWAESLQMESAASLAQYSGQPFEGLSALAVNATGKGETYTTGFWPLPDQASALLRYLLGRAGVETLPELPEGVISIRRGAKRVFLNFNESESPIYTHGAMTIIAPRSVKIDE
jgi:beta-galactosidase